MNERAVPLYCWWGLTEAVCSQASRSRKHASQQSWGRRQNSCGRHVSCWGESATDTYNNTIAFLLPLRDPLFIRLRPPSALKPSTAPIQSAPYLMHRCQHTCKYSSPRTLRHLWGCPAILTLTWPCKAQACCKWACHTQAWGPQTHWKLQQHMASAAPLSFDRRPLMLLVPTAWALPRVHLCLLQASSCSHIQYITLHRLLLRPFSSSRV